MGWGHDYSAAAPAVSISHARADRKISSLPAPIAKQSESTRTTFGGVFAACLGLLATWLTAGSLGAMNPMLQTGLATLAVLAAILFIGGTQRFASADGRVRAWRAHLFLRSWIRGRDRSGRVTKAEPVLARDRGVSRLVPAALLVIGAPWLLSDVNCGPAWIAIVYVMLSASAVGADRRLLRIVAWSIFGFAIYRSVFVSGSLGWHITDALGQGLCGVVSRLTGHRVASGAGFAGLDFLVLTLLFTSAWTTQVQGWRQGLFWAGGAIVVGHLFYLSILVMTPTWARQLPPISIPEFSDPYTPPPFQWSKAGLWLLPWYLPIIAAAIHTAIVAAMARWSIWSSSSEFQRICCVPVADNPRRRRWLTFYLPVVLAAIVPIVALLSPHRLSLQGKTIAAFESGTSDWNVPGHGVYGQQSAGLFGLLPVLSQSLGGVLFLTKDLSAEELAATDVLLLLNPDATLTDVMQQRVWQYVQDGGALLIAAEGYYPNAERQDVVSALLRPTSLVVHRDTAASAMGHWQFSVERLAHPVSESLGRGTVPMLTDTGASIGVGWAAQPIVVGRWGWSAPQQDAIWDATEYFRTTDRLGNVVLAAEQRFGNGRVVVLGDSMLLSNEALVHNWAFAGELLAHLADGNSTPQAMWRQAIAMWCSIVLVLALLGTVKQREMVAVLLTFVLAMIVCQWVNERAVKMVPNGHWITMDKQVPGRGSRLAYIDASHLGSFSWQDWGFDSLNGLSLTLMRSDYLPLVMTEMSASRLADAGILVVIGPNRDFSWWERAEVDAFLRRGGILICLAGAEDATALNRLLARFEVHIDRSPVPTDAGWREPEPIGRVLLPYYHGTRADGSEYDANAAFFAAWPVRYAGQDVEVLVSDGRGRPIVISRKIGRGELIVVGDTYFAANRNLEYAGGEPFDGRYDNADFWRWLISRSTEKEAWSPPPPSPPEAADQSEPGTTTGGTDSEGGA